MKEDKYRPVLTTTQILTIISLAKQPPVTEENASIITSLSSILTKIQNKAIKPAYTVSPAKPTRSPQTMLEDLGMDQDSSPVPLDLSKPHYWEECYKKYTATPAACSLTEIDAAKEHMYLHNLMDDETKKEFESKLLGNV